MTKRARIIISLIQHKQKDRNYGVYTVGFKILSNDGNLKEIYIQGKRAKSLTADKIVGDSGNFSNACRIMGHIHMLSLLYL